MGEKFAFSPTSFGDIRFFSPMHSRSRIAVFTNVCRVANFFSVTEHVTVKCLPRYRLSLPSTGHPTLNLVSRVAKRRDLLARLNKNLCDYGWQHCVVFS